MTPRPSKMQLHGAAVVVLVFAAGFVAADTKYTTKYDNIDIDKILSNERVLSNYIKCLMDEGPCTPDGRELKSKLSSFYIFIIVFCVFNF